MAIEFTCPNCSAVLRVADENAGMSAKCPTCESISTIPAASPSADPPPSSNPGANPFAETTYSDAGANASPNPYAAPASQSLGMDYGANSANFGTQQPTTVEVGPIFNHAMAVWQRHLGLLVGIFAVMYGISFGLSFISGIVAEEVDESMGQLFNLLNQVIQIFLQIGAARVCLAVSRGQQAAFGMLFNGGDKFLPVLGASILAGIAVVLGFLLLIIPGILLCLFFWPFYFYVVDNQSTVMDSFSKAYAIAKPNAGTTFLLWLISCGVMLLGCLAVCVGVLFAGPLVSVMWSTAYLMMKGELSQSPQLS